MPREGSSRIYSIEWAMSMTTSSTGRSSKRNKIEKYTKIPQIIEL